MGVWLLPLGSQANVLFYITEKYIYIDYGIPPVSMLYRLAVVGFSKEIVYSFGTNLLELAFPNLE